MHKMLRFFVYLNFIFWFALSSSWGGEVRHGIGLNKFDLFLQYLGQASGGDGSPAYRAVTRAMAKKAIGDAKNIGVSYLRVSVMGYFPIAYGDKGSLDFWRSDEPAYWKVMDQMMADLDAAGIQLIPVFVWNKVQLPALAHETIADLLTNKDSKSYQLLTTYTAEFISRYKSRPTVLFYELTNELNLGSDIDIIERCKKEFAFKRCEPIANYSTAQMIEFTSRFSALIRNLDSSRLISSGFSVPRPAAEGLRHKPEWVTGDVGRPADDTRDFEKNLLAIHKNIDIVSVHLYPLRGKPRFGEDEIVLLQRLKQITDKAGKKLFVGEFGGPNGAEVGNDSFMDKMIAKIEALDVLYSAPWGWEFYQKATYSTRDTDATVFAVEPGYSDRIMGVIKAANYRLGQHTPPQAPKDQTQPVLVLTWPLPCQAIKGKQLVHATASDDLSGISRVEFTLGDTRNFSVTKVPFQWELDTSDLQPGVYSLQATSINRAGNATSVKRSVYVNQPQQVVACLANLQTTK
jgi:hypothetical protein